MGGDSAPSATDCKSFLCAKCTPAGSHRRGRRRSRGVDGAFGLVVASDPDDDLGVVERHLGWFVGHVVVWTFADVYRCSPVGRRAVSAPMPFRGVDASGGKAVSKKLSDCNLISFSSHQGDTPSAKNFGPRHQSRRICHQSAGQPGRIAAWRTAPTLRSRSRSCDRDEVIE
jgi:hypothetical protein